MENKVRKARKDTRRKKRNWKEGRVPITIEMTAKTKAKLVKKAKQMGMSTAELSSLILERMVLENKRRETVRQEIKSGLDAYMFELADIASQIEKTNRVLKRVLDNPSADIEALMKEVEEERQN